MRQSESWGAIAVPVEAHSKQWGLPLRMHEPGELKYGQNGQRVALSTHSTYPSIQPFSHSCTIHPSWTIHPATQPSNHPSIYLLETYKTQCCLAVTITSETGSIIQRFIPNDESLADCNKSKTFNLLAQRSAALSVRSTEITAPSRHGVQHLIDRRTFAIAFVGCKQILYGYVKGACV